MISPSQSASVTRRRLAVKPATERLVFILPNKICNELKEKSVKIVLFNSLRNSKRRNKGNFTSKSNSNEIMLCGGGRG